MGKVPLSCKIKLLVTLFLFIFSWCLIPDFITCRKSRVIKWKPFSLGPKKEGHSPRRSGRVEREKTGDENATACLSCARFSWTTYYNIAWVKSASWLANTLTPFARELHSHGNSETDSHSAIASIFPLLSCEEAVKNVLLKEYNTCIKR